MDDNETINNDYQVISPDTQEGLVTIINDSLYRCYFKEIKKSIHNKNYTVCFILLTCFIDVLAGFYAGMTEREKRKDSGIRFKNFVCEYLPQYDKNKLWSDLRCDLVHSYAFGKDFIFTQHEKLGPHLSKTNSNKTIINLDDFYNDVDSAYYHFRDDILNDSAIYGKARKRYESIGILTAVESDSEYI